MALFELDIVCMSYEELKFSFCKLHQVLMGFLNNLYTFKITQNNQVDHKFKFKTCVYISIQQENTKKN